MHIDGEPIHSGKEILIETISAGLNVITSKASSQILPIQRPIEDIQLFFREFFQRFDLLK